jgi:hypothetical protein
MMREGSFSTHPIRVFRLQFQLADFEVPKGEAWKLIWRSPYAPGDICPTYDARIIRGTATIGLDRSIQATAFDNRPGECGFLDLAATNGLAVVWLEPGTKFGIANDILRIEVEVFSSPTFSPSACFHQ